MSDIVDLLNNEMDNLVDDYAKRRISDLEAKLAEKEHTINTLIEDHKASQEWYKMQLADTEAQNKRVLEKLDIIVRSNQELEKQHDIDNQVIQLMEDNREKDKISFAVEQLEKVKELLLENLYDLYSKPSEIWDKYGDLYDVVVEGAVNGTIDNQIKQLTHQHEDKGE